MWEQTFALLEICFRFFFFSIFIIWNLDWLLQSFQAKDTALVFPFTILFQQMFHKKQDEI